MGALAYEQLFQADALRPQIVELFDQHRRVHHHPIPDHIDGAGIEDAGWYDVQLERAAVVHDSMAGIVPATVADHQACPLGQQIDDMTFAFVAPLGANYCDDRHSCFPSASMLSEKGAQAAPPLARSVFDSR